MPRNSIPRWNKKHNNKKHRPKQFQLEPLEARELLAGDVVMFNDTSPGPQTHANATSYIANGSASGNLRDIATGQPTSVRLATSTTGVVYENSATGFAAGTDAHEIFDGFVDFSAGDGASLALSGNASYSYSLTGLNPDKSYDIAASAARGNPSYTDRWTRVWLVSADSHVEAHSDGPGIVTGGSLLPGEAAIWAGANHESDQGYVVRWSNVKSGDDGSLALIMRQYTGATPGVGDGTADGSKGYGLTGLRIIERDGTMQVIASDPSPGEALTSAPTTVTLDFSREVDATTVDAGDLLIDGVPAAGFTVVDADTVTWDVPGGILPGDHTLTMQAGALTDADGLGVGPFSATFTILTEPTVSNVPATNVMPTSATIAANVQTTGGQNPQISIYWGGADGGTDTGAWDHIAELGSGPVGTHAVEVTDLTQLTTYYYRAFVSNAAGGSWASSTATFTTGRVDVPRVATAEASSVASSSARLNGQVTDTGGDTPQVTLYFGDEDGGTDAAAWDSAVPLGDQAGAFSYFVTNLSPETEYFYRAYGENQSGGSWSDFTTAFTTSEPVEASIVINEIHYDPDIATELVEFVELHNPTEVNMDVSNWSLDRAVDFTFPPGSTIDAGGYFVVAEDSAEFAAKFGFAPDGTWESGDRLNNDGETVELLDAAGVRVDRVSYRLGYPWPTVGGGGRSIELVNPAFDNDLAGNWRGSSGDSGLPDSPITLLPATTEWRYRKGTSEASTPTSAWRLGSFVEDDTWTTGRTPIGYADGDDNTVLSDMRNNYPSVFLRNTFDVDEIPPQLLVRVYVDDGAIVWINGQEVARLFVSSGPKAHDDTTGTGSHERSWEDVLLSNPAAFLTEGENTIAIQAINATLGSSDLSIDANVIIPGAGTVGGVPSPGQINSVYATNVAPQTRQVDHRPNEPVAGEDVTITIKITDDDGVDAVTLDYQLVDPGNYIRITDAAYQASWTSMVMRDDGTGGDERAGDDVFSAVLPGDLQTHRRLVRYRIHATDRVGTSVTVPYVDDPQPNFAYFVYDGVPDWRGSLRPGVSPVETYSAESLNRVATYHLIANSTDVENSQYNSSFNEVQFFGTMVYDGIVYDHIEFRNRGQASTYQVGKNKWKINFTRGHAFEARDNYGNKYDVAWDKMNILPGTNPWWRDNQSTEGTVLFEPAAFRIYELAGTPSSHTQYFQFRVIDGSSESTADQYSGDFWGLYIAIEQPDGRFLDERGLPDGNIFNMHGGTGSSTSTRSQGSRLPDDRSDLSSFINNYRNTNSLNWWEENLNWESYFAWYAINLAVNNSDLRPDENVNYYHNQDTGQWYILPWDLDLTFEDLPHLGRSDSGWERIQRLFSTQPEARLAFANYTRNLLDLLLDNDEAGLVTQEYVDILTGGETSGTIVQADRAHWDYHPRKRKKGIYYANFTPALMPSRTFESLAQYMKTFVTEGGYGRDRLRAKVSDQGIPGQPTISYVGQPSFPKNGLSFQTSAFVDPQGVGTFAGMQWRVAEVHNPSVANYDPTEPFIYEIEGTWESDISTTFESQMTVPSEAVEVGKTYRDARPHARSRWELGALVGSDRILYDNGATIRRGPVSAGERNQLQSRRQS